MQKYANLVEHEQCFKTHIGRPKWISMQNALREEWASSTARSAIDQRRRDSFTKEEVGKPPERVTNTRKRFCATPMRRKTELTNKKAPGWLRETKLPTDTHPINSDLNFKMSTNRDETPQRCRQHAIRETLATHVYRMTSSKETELRAPN